MLLHSHHEAVLGERQLLRHFVLRALAHAEAGRTRSSRAAGLVAAISSLAAAMLRRKLIPTQFRLRAGFSACTQPLSLAQVPHPITLGS